MAGRLSVVYLYLEWVAAALPAGGYLAGIYFKDWALKIFRIIVTVSVVISFGFFIYTTDLNATFRLLRSLGWGLLWIPLCTFVAYVLGTAGWYFCLENRSVSLVRLFVYRLAGETVGLFNPASIVGGDIIKSGYLVKHGIPRDDAARSVVLSRIMAVISQILLMIVSAIWLLSQLKILTLPWQIFLVPGLILLLIRPLKNYLTSRKPQWIKKAKEFMTGLKHFVKANPRAAVASFIFFLLHWVAGSLELYIILKLLGHSIPVFYGVFMDMGVILVKSVGAFIPGQLGIEELGNKLVLEIVGIASYQVWLSVTILRRSRQLFWAIPGFLIYFKFLRQEKDRKS